MVVIKPGPHGMSVGTVVEVDGVELKNVTRIDLVMVRDHPIKAVIEVSASVDEINLDAHGVTVIAVNPESPTMAQAAGLET